MNKIISFLMVGLFFAVFNVATVAAQAAVPAPPLEMILIVKLEMV